MFFAQEDGWLRRLPAEPDLGTTAVAAEPLLGVDQSTGTATHAAQSHNSPAEHTEECLVPQQEKPQSEPRHDDPGQPQLQLDHKS